MPEKNKLPLILLDRDGTLIEERAYPSDPKEVKLLPGVIPALRRLQNAGFPLVVITNQSGVGRGIVTRRQMLSVQNRFLDVLRARGIRLQGYYVCPHAPKEKCPCRKPKLLLVKRAARKLKRSWRRSISVGDRPSDVAMGKRTGGIGLLVHTGYGRQFKGKARADAEVRDLSAAASWILNYQKKAGEKNA